MFLPADAVADVVALAFGIRLELGPQLGVVVAFAAVYMLVFGVMLLILTVDRVRYRAFAIPALLLFGLRLLNRLLLYGALADAGMAPTRNAVGTALFLAFFVGILALYPRDATDAHTPDTAGQ
jgi:hypothetical protein